MKVYHKILCIFILAVLLLPFIQGTFNLFKIRGLKGDIELAPNANFDFTAIYTSSYQQKKEKYLNDHFGFRNDAVRLRNQLYFSLFNKAKAKGVIIGKDYYLYEENYIKAYFGSDFIGEDSIKKRLQKLKFVQNALEKKGKTLLFIIAPGKGSFYPEYFPDEFKTYKKSTTNYEVYSKYLHDLNINNIDFNGYFIQQKNKSEYLLYPKYGIHWSHYGSCLAADSIIRFIEKIRNIDLRNLTWKKVNIENAHDIDVDIAKGMNLLYDTKFEKMAYPLIDETNDANYAKPHLALIGDSFHWTLIDVGFLKSFANFNYWYYNKEVYHSKYEEPTSIEKIDFKKQIETNDIFIILSTDANLPNAGWGFIEQAYSQLQTQ